MCVISKLNVTPRNTVLVFVPDTDTTYTQYYFNDIESHQPVSMIFATNELVTLEEVDSQSDECMYLKGLANCKPNFTKVIRQRFKHKIINDVVSMNAEASDATGVYCVCNCRVINTKNYTCAAMQKKDLNAFIKEHSTYFDIKQNLLRDFVNAYNDEQHILICRTKSSIDAGVIKLKCRYSKTGIIVPLMHETNFRSPYKMNQRILVHNSLKTKQPLTQAFTAYYSKPPVKPSLPYINTLFTNELGLYSLYILNKSGTEYTYNKEIVLNHQTEIIDFMLQDIEFPYEIIPIDERICGSFVSLWNVLDYTLAILDITSPINRDIVI